MRSWHIILLVGTILISCKTTNTISSLASDQNDKYMQLLIENNMVSDYRTGAQVYYLEQDATLLELPQYILKRGYHGYKLIRAESKECRVTIKIYVKDKNSILNYQTCEDTQIASDPFIEEENRVLEFADGTTLKVNKINSTTYAVEQQGKIVARLTRERVGMEKQDGSYRPEAWRADFYIDEQQPMVDVIVLAFWQITKPHL